MPAPTIAAQKTASSAPPATSRMPRYCQSGVLTRRCCPAMSLTSAMWSAGARHVAEDREGGRRDDGGHDGEPVQPVGEVHRVDVPTTTTQPKKT